MDKDHGIERMLTGLLDASHLASLDQVPDLVAEYAPHAGLDEVLIYFADLQQDVLRLLTGAAGGASPVNELKIDGSPAGQAFQEVRMLADNGPAGDAEHWWVPLLDGTERLGVLRITPAPGQDAAVTERMRHLASLIALVVVSSRPYSDTFAQLVRTRPMNVAAEMQWNLMPPLTFACPEVTIGAVLEPAYEIGGDAFDYALTADRVHLGIFDAMGHDVSAGLAANLAIASCRNQRRQGTGLAESSRGIERTLIEEFGEDTRFVTAIMAELDINTGVLRWVNRGHQPPVVIRGGRWTTMQPCPPATPLGLGLGLESEVAVCAEQLEPGDRVLLYTDGITEARNTHGQEFGLQRFVEFLMRYNAAGLPVPETLRRLIRAVLAYHDDTLRDDATVLLAEWHGTAAGQSPPPGDHPMGRADRDAAGQFGRDMGRSRR
jgi:stage II sporulation SpoE-like protein